MNKEEILNKYIDLIDKGYCSDCNELNCIDNFPYAKITHAIRELQQENQELKKQYCERTDCSGRIGNSKKVEELQKENKQLKERIEYLERSNNRREDIILEQRQEINNLETQQKEFIKYLELEKDYFVRGCSNIYEDSLGKTRLVNEDIFDEIDNILQKYREIIGVSDETN